MRSPQPTINYSVNIPTWSSFTQRRRQSARRAAKIAGWPSWSPTQPEQVSIKNFTCLSGNIPSQTKLKSKQVWVEKGFMGNSNGAFAVCSLWFAARKRQTFLTTGKPIDNPLFLYILAGECFLRSAEALEAD